MKRISSIILLFASIQFCAAQVTLEECRQKAVQNHPSIQMYDLIDATRDFSISNASRQWLPQIRIGTLAGVVNNVPSLDDFLDGVNDSDLKQSIKDSFTDMGLKDPSNYVYKVEAELNQIIYDGGSTKTARQKAQTRAELQKAETDVTCDQIQSKVDEVFFSILLLEKRIMGVNSKIKVLEAARNNTLDAFNNGSARQSELDELDAAKIEAEQQLIELESNADSFRKVLSLLTGEDMSTDELLVPSLPEQVRVDPRTSMLDKQQELLSVEKQELDVMLRPTLSFFADTYYGYPNLNIIQDLLSENPKFNAYVGLKLSWNLSAFYTRKNDLGILSASRDRINVQKNILVRDIQLQNTSVNSELQRLGKSIQKDKELVILRERIRKNAELSYSQGTIKASDLISVVNDEYQAALNAEIHEIEILHESSKLRQ